MNYRTDISVVSEQLLPWEKFSQCNILITGATGLIGSCLTDVLMTRRNRDYSVYAMGRNKERMKELFSIYDQEEGFHLICSDVTRPLMLGQPFHYIIHCASGSSPSDFSQYPVEVMKANIYGVANILEYGRIHGMKRMLYISSGEVYGEGDGRVFHEEYSGYVNPILPRSCYPSAKRAAETMCASYVKEYGVDVLIARPCHIYGPKFSKSDNRVYAQFIRNVLRDEDIVMKSSGEQFRSWCYVVDCVSALLHILLKGSCGQAYNVADNSSNITIKDLAVMIASIAGKTVRVELPSDTEKNGYNTVNKSLFSTEKLEDLGWRIDGTMHDKMVRTINECKLLL